MRSLHALPLLLPALLALAGCSKLDDDDISYGGMTNQDFLDQYSEAWCQQTLDCYPGTYTDLDECLAEYDALWGDFAMYADECQLIPSQADACIGAVQDGSCDELFSGADLPECNNLWEC